MHKLGKSLIAALCTTALLVACTDTQPAAPAADDLAATPEFARRGPLVHHVSVGGADVCEALGLPTGCDANFSLTANMKADGSVSGQWQDSFGHGSGGIHVSIDCLNVVGNGAVVGGVITHGTVGGADVSGQRALTAVVDNGTFKNDPPDLLGFSLFPVGGLICTDFTPDIFPLGLRPLTNGQVTVR